MQESSHPHPWERDRSFDSSYLQDLKVYGYSETEAAFLRLVALHSGVFLARQFNDFAQAKAGKRVDSFLKKLEANLTFAVGEIIDPQVVYFQSRCSKSLHYSFNRLRPSQLCLTSAV
ncbi:MAG: hypothetical protein AB1898_33075, partial [Acidobacteriota bacterium]